MASALHKRYFRFFMLLVLSALAFGAPGPCGPFNGTLQKTADGRQVALLPQGTGSMPRDPTRENGGQDHATFLAALPLGELHEHHRAGFSCTRRRSFTCMCKTFYLSSNN